MIRAHETAAVVSMACLGKGREKMLLTGGSDGQVRLWDTVGGQLINDFLEERASSAVWQVGCVDENKVVALFERVGEVVLGVSVCLYVFGSDEKNGADLCTCLQAWAAQSGAA